MTDVSPGKNIVAGNSNLPTLKKDRDEATANIAASEKAAGAPSISVPAADAARVSSIGGALAASELPSNGRSVTNLQQLSTAQRAQVTTSRNVLADEKDLPPLKVERAAGQDGALAGISGHITDRSGANIAGAKVTVQDATGKTRETTAGADGSFHLTELPAGQYELTATANGFKTIKQSVQLNPSQLAVLQPMLDIGTMSEQVTVEAGAQHIQTEDGSLSPNVDARVFGENGDGRSVSHGKRFLALDSTGNLLLSRNGGKRWKKVNPQWAGKAVRVELTPAYRNEAPPQPKNETSGKPSEAAVFQLTTDAGTVWTSKDGAHWHQR
jgi:hypothetical protein